MKNQTYIGLAFAIIILLLVSQGLYSLSYFNTIATQTKNLYNHSYTVSNAARNISINLISMHRLMKDVALADSMQDIKTASSMVDKHEGRVHKNFNLIFDRYLGKRSDIQSVYKAFLDWKAIRDEVIFLKTTGKNSESANITKNAGAKHIRLLNQETQKLIDFTDIQAKIFLTNAVQARNNAFTVITVLLITTFIASILTSYYALKHLISAQKEMSSRIHLIDQNILIAKFDIHGVVVDISNHLCRYLGVTKNKILGKKTNFFITDDDGDVQPDNIFNIINTGKTWEGVIRRVSTNGDIQWIHSSVHPEFDENYKPCGYTNVILDITDQELSITDTLTGLYNRRHFESVIEKEITLRNRNKTTLTFAVIDIDYFKKYNDHYGHPAGDTTLRNVAHALKQSLRRPNDYVFRLGGEEFGIILTGLDTEHSINFLEAIRKNIEMLKIEHIESDVCKFVTISSGAHVYNGRNTLDSNQLYVKADEALYEAKIKRNHVVVT